MNKPYRAHIEVPARDRRAAGRSRVDILSEPVDAMKVRTDYHGLPIGFATVDERDEVIAAAGLSAPQDHKMLLSTAQRPGV